MKLTNEEFVSHLAAAMQIDENEAKIKLSHWVRRIGDELDNSGSCILEGVGVLTRHGDDVVFVPDERLAVEVNYKYAGMLPVQLTPARPGEVVPPNSLSAGSDTGEPKVSDMPFSYYEQREDTFTSEPVETSGQKPLPDAGRPVEIPGQAQGGEAGDVTDMNAAGADEARESFVKHDDAEKVLPPHADEDVKDSAAEPVTERHSKDSQAEKPRTSILLKLIPVAAVLIVAFLLYVHFDGQRLDQSNLGPLSDQEQIWPVVPLPSSGEDVNETSIRPEMTTDIAGRETDQDHTRADGMVPENDTNDFYGLHGSVHSPVSGAYSIVVYSLSNAERARNERNKLEELGFRALLWMATTQDGSSTWRVGAGQFRSVEDALAVADHLPEPYKSNHFIIRIQ